MVEREFGGSYLPDQIGRLMHSLGWTPQKPEMRAMERNADEIERWKLFRPAPAGELGSRCQMQAGAPTPDRRP